MKKIFKIYILLFVLFFIAGCGGGSSYGDKVAKEIKNGKLIANVPASSIKDKLIKEGFTDKNTEVYGFKAYKIPYTTTDQEGNSVKASGVMIVPSSYGTDTKAKEKVEFMQAQGFAMVVDCHGTIFANSEAPSVDIAKNGARGAGVLYSSVYGFITLQADYIGFGDSNSHYHPYLLKKASANAVVDFTKAAIEFAKINNIPMAYDYGIYLSGYSQGGAVALAALEKMQKEDMYVNIATPMDGPYVIEPIANAVFKASNIDAPSFVADIAYAYAKAYHKDIKELIQEPYASKLPTLFSGNYTREEIDAKLTTKVKGKGGLFSSSIIDKYSTSWFRLKLLKNSVTTFEPLSKTRLIHCRGDNVIPYRVAKDSRKIYKYLFGADDIEVIAVEDEIKSKNLNHIECALPAYKISAKLFAKERKKILGY